jgi:hypothetical protein
MEVRVEERVGRFEVSFPARGVVHCVIAGGATETMSPQVFAALENQVQLHGTLAMFFDAGEMHSYTTAFRKQWTGWLKQHRPHISQLEVFLRSAVVRMGVNLVNPLIGNFIHASSDRVDFERLLREAIEARR